MVVNRTAIENLDSMSCSEDIITLHSRSTLGMSSSQASIGRATSNKSAGPDRIELEKLTEFPEGGTRAWMVVLGAFCVSFSTFGYMNAFG